MRGPAKTATVLLLLSLLLAGCGWLGKKQAMPTELRSPYPQPKLWAVVPVRNESGTSLVDSAALADKLAAEVHQVTGIQIIAVNRVIQAMHQAELPAVTSVGDAMTLMQTLGADGLIVGTLTAWDPYEPPKIGMTIQLYSRRKPDGSLIDTRRLTYAATDELPPGAVRYQQPVATATGFFDAANAAVMARLKFYSEPRTPPQSAAGWRRYLLSMDLYSEFVSHELIRELLWAERLRLSGESQAEELTSNSP